MDYCKGHSGYGVDSQGNCLFCGKPRQFSDNDTDDIPVRWKVSGKKKSESIEVESTERDLDHPVFKCKECGLVTLVKIREDWYVCVNKECRACGSSSDAVVRLEVLNEIKVIEDPDKLSSPEKRHVLELEDINRGLPEDYVDSDIILSSESSKESKIDSRIEDNQISLQTCPECKQRSLMLNTSNNRYECLNNKCRRSFFTVSVDRYNQQVLSDQESLNELDRKKTRAWFGNQYYDPKKKKWRDGKESIKIRWKYNKWIWLAPLLFILISIIATVIINYFFPGHRFIIFGW